MKGPFLLPNNIKEGDYIELGQLGAYGLTFRTNFNGFYSNEIFEVNDKPIMSIHEESKDKVDSLVIYHYQLFVLIWIYLSWFLLSHIHH